MDRPRWLIGIVVFAGLGASLPPASCADVVHLKDGSTLHGDVKRNGDQYLVVAEDGTTTVVKPEQVQAVEVGRAPTTSSADQAALGLASLRRAVQRVGDTASVIARYQQFLDRYGGTPSGAEALKDLAIWQDRQRRGLVLLGDQWMTLAERAQRQQQAQDLAKRAAEAMTHGPALQADALIDQALSANPQDPSALYLRALVLAGRGDVASARRMLEASDQAMPNQGPTLNNLAVLLWRQKQRTTALHYYELAMAAGALDRRIVDNVAEALHAADKATLNGRSAQRTQQLFAHQESQIEQALAAQGWYRWGSSWINQDQQAQLQAQQQEVQQRVADVERGARDAQDQIHNIDADITNYQQSIQQIESNSYARDAKGNLVQLPYPDVYYALQQKLQSLQSRRGQLAEQVASLQERARQVHQQAPQPTFSGTQQLIGPDGMPVRVPDTAAAAPATAAAEQ